MVVCLGPRGMLTVREVAKLLKVSTATEDKLCARRELEHVRVLNVIRIPSETVGTLPGVGRSRPGSREVYRLHRYQMDPRATLTAFDPCLADRGLALEAVVVGGAALNLLRLISRQTRDCDILHPSLPAEILAAAHTFAAEAGGGVLGDEWLNNGPSQLAPLLPAGWELRLQEAFRGRAVTLRTLHRSDLLKVKLFALCDRGLDLPDCVALAPTPAELAEAVAWLEPQDLNPGWPAHVRATLEDLARRLGHGP